MLETAITSLYILVGSYHLHKDSTLKYNEFNPGIIAEVNHDWIIGTYRNSRDRTTVLGGYRFRLIGSGSVNVGGIAAVCSGYDVPVCAALQVDYKAVSVVITPPVGQYKAAVGLAIRIPLGG